MIWQNQISSYDERRDLVIPGDSKTTLDFCVAQFISIANEAISKRGIFTVALSGGSTPKAIYQRLADPEHRSAIDWKRVLLFWSDERCVAPTDPESNYHTAMEAGFSSLPLLPENIFRMQGEIEPEKSATLYENLIIEHVPHHSFDLVMLGMGDDGHTASLFPKTHGLHASGRLVIANFVPQKHTWRLSLTFDCINSGKYITIYVLGKSKAEMLAKVLTEPYDPDLYPSQKIGTRTHKALWIVDQEAASKL